MKGAKLLGARDTVVLLPVDQDVILGRGSYNIPATDKRCSRQSIKVRFDSKAPNSIQITQLGVNPGIIMHGTPQEAYMTKDTTYSLLDGQKMTVLMHDYEFVASIPNASPPESSAPKPVAATPLPKNLDWMTDSDEDEGPKPASTGAPPYTTPAAPKAKPICKYGVKCYRKNPDHFAEYSHPHLEGSPSEIPTKPSPSPPAPAAASASPPAAITEPKAIIKSNSMDVTHTEPEKPAETSKIASSTSDSTVMPTTATNSSTSLDILEPREASTAKRPMPAVDLVDDEENYLPASKKPKKALIASISTAKSSNAMDWLSGDSTETSEQITPAEKKKPIPPPPVAFPTSSPSSTPTGTPKQSQSLTVSNSQVSSTSETKAAKVESSTSLGKLPTLKKSATSKSPEPSEATEIKLKSSSTKDWEALEVILKLEPPKTKKRAILLAHLGRVYEPQESVLLMVEIIEKYLAQLSASSEVKVWYWPDSAASAALFRKTQGSGADTKRFVMCLPGSSLPDALQKIQDDGTEELTVLTDANWRFKGNGKSDSLNVLLHNLVGPSLASDAKALYNVGTEACAYPMVIKPGKAANTVSAKSLSSESSTSNVTVSSFPCLKYVIHVVVPTFISTASGETAPNTDLLRQSFCSALASFVQLP